MGGRLRRNRLIPETNGMKSNASVPFPDARPQRGSALIIVLGILAVMLIMGVAFSLFMRGERGGTTNLKNSLVAKQALESAVGRAMEAIDLSFETVKYDGGGFYPNCPVPVWPQPFLASSRVNGFQSTILGATEQPPAFILTKEIADSLSPSQLALVKSAKAEWIPLNSDVCTTSENNPGSSTVGRYAFIALDTTGLVDVNSIGVGTDAERLDGNGSNPETFRMPAQSDTGSGSDAIPFILKSPGSFASQRDSLGEVISFFDLRSMGSTMFDLEPAALDSSRDKPSDSTLPADLFGFYPLSLEDLDPEGSPKVLLPSKDDLSKSEKVLGTLKRTFPAMVRIFAKSRQSNKSAPSDGTKKEKESYFTFFGNGSGKSMKVSRARLATVALLDSMDDDNKPGRRTGTGAARYWEELADLDFSDTIGSETVTDNPEARFKTVAKKDDGYLNFPCTESVPLPSSCYAHARITGRTTAIDKANPANSKVTYNGIVVISGIAANQNWTTNTSLAGSSYTLDLDYKVCQRTPGSGSDDVLTALNYTGEKGQSAKWNSFFKTSKASNTATISGNKNSKQGDRTLQAMTDFEFTIECTPKVEIVSGEGGGGGEEDDPGGGGGGGGGDDPDPFDDDPDPFDDDPGSGGGGGGGGGSDPDPFDDEPDPFDAPPPPPAASGDTVTTYKLDFSTAQIGSADNGMIRVPVRVKFTVKSGSDIVAQAPAPEIDSEEYWIPMEMQIPLITNTCTVTVTETSSGSKTGTGGVVRPSLGDAEKSGIVGWAFCTCPAFAFDTTCLKPSAAEGAPAHQPSKMMPKDPDDTGFWLNDAYARLFGGGGSSEFDNFDAPPPPSDTPRPPAAASDDAATQLQNACGELAAALDIPYNDVYSGPLAYDEFDANGEDSFNLFQSSYLFNKEFPKLFSVYINKSDTHVPDVLHGCYKNPASDQLFGFRPGSDKGYFFDRFTHIDDCPFQTIGKIGDVMCGPYETLSIFQTYRYGASGFNTDYHRVYDYFTTSTDRWPTETKTEEEWAKDSLLDSDPNKYQRYPAIHMGRVNLNCPLLIERSSGKNVPLRVRKTGEKNVYPLIAAIKGAAITSTLSSRSEKHPLSGPAAGEVAMALTSSTQTKAVNTIAGVDCSRGVVQGISGIGCADVDEEYNYGLEMILDECKAYSDADRESLLQSCEGALTTRGQSYLVIIRADAYTPKFGMGDDPEGGTTLATTHAILELFRDPEPSRLADGTLPLDADGNPVYYHNWLIRSYRVF